MLPDDGWNNAMKEYEREKVGRANEIPLKQ